MMILKKKSYILEEFPQLGQDHNFSIRNMLEIASIAFQQQWLNCKISVEIQWLGDGDGQAMAQI